MKLSTKGRYAVMAMVDLAANGVGKPVALADVADRQGVRLVDVLYVASDFETAVHETIHHHARFMARTGPGFHPCCSFDATASGTVQ